MDCCIEWLGTINTKGYGVISINGKQWRAHRLALIVYLGKNLPKNKVIDHLCRNRACVNPTHLELITNVENVMRGNSFGAKNKVKTHCKKGHPLDFFTRSAKGRDSIWRSCSICREINWKTRYALKKKLLTNKKV